MPKLNHIKAKNHDILFDLETGDYTVEKRDLVFNNYVNYDPDITPINFKNALKDIFRLTGESQQLINHFFEVLGDTLVFPNNKIVLYGDLSTSEKLTTIINAITSTKSNIITTDEKLVTENKLFKCDYKEDFVFPVNRCSYAATLLLADALSYELPGILRVSIVSLSKLIRRGYYNTPETCKTSLRSILQSFDAITSFVDKKIINTNNHNVYSKLTDVYKSFLLYTGGMSYMSKYKLQKELTNRGIIIEKRKGVLCCLGILLKKH